MTRGDIGIGILGCGFVGAAHARALQQLPAASVRAVAGGTGTSAHALAVELACASEDTAVALVSREDVHAVVIATPSNLHAEHAVLAATHGKHVFLEMPMALSVRECDAIIDTVQRSGTILMLGAMLHYYDGIRKAKRAVERGAIGQPYIASVAHTSWASRPVGTWKDRRASSGGHLFHHIHEIDLLRWFVGDITSVFARERSFADPERDDALLATLEFENGAVGILEHGQGFRIGERMITINGSHGALRINHRDASVLFRREGEADTTAPLLDDAEANRSMTDLFQRPGPAYGKPGLRPWPFLRHAFNQELRDFLGVVDGGLRGDHVCWLLDPRQGRAAVAVAEAAVTSAHVHQPVQVVR